VRAWLNWREIEKMNAWGVRRKDDEEARKWDESAAQWRERTIREGNAGERQVALMDRLELEDTLIDIGCGTGPLTLPAARRVRTVYALDSSPRMLEMLIEDAKAQGIGNIIPICGNWYAMEAGRDYPVCDIAIGRHAPFQNDVLGVCRAARKYCYSLWNVASTEESDYHLNEGVLADARKNPRRTYNEPDGRLFGFNVHFNILYDAGVNPEVKYDTEVREFTADSPEALLAQVFPGAPAAGLPGPLRRELERSMRRTELGWYLRQVRRVSILGWDPGPLTELPHISPESYLE